MILRCHDKIDWKMLLSHMELYWEVLLMALLNFRFVYPSERHARSALADGGAARSPEGPDDGEAAGKRVCRGRIFSPRDYPIDVDEWGFSEAVGNLEEQYGD